MHRFDVDSYLATHPILLESKLAHHIIHNRSLFKIREITGVDKVENPIVCFMKVTLGNANIDTYVFLPNGNFGMKTSIAWFEHVEMRKSSLKKGDVYKVLYDPLFNPPHNPLVLQKGMRLPVEIKKLTGKIPFIGIYIHPGVNSLISSLSLGIAYSIPKSQVSLHVSSDIEDLIDTCKKYDKA